MVIKQKCIDGLFNLLPPACLEIFQNTHEFLNTESKFSDHEKKRYK